MTDPQGDTNYSILISKRADEYELRIRELLLSVRGPNLLLAYDQLLRRKQEIIDWAGTIGALDEVPPPKAPPPVLGAALVDTTYFGLLTAGKPTPRR